MSTNITPHNPLEGDRPELSISLSGDGSDEQISIIVVHKDKPEFLNLCLQSIHIMSINNNYEIIVVDNTTPKDKRYQDTQEFLDDIEGDGIKVVRNEENLYWGPAINKGVEKADKGSNYFLFLHCDVVIENTAWIDLLINVAEAQNAGMVGVELQSYFMQNQKVDFIQEYCLLMTRKAWEDVGPYPESVPQIGPNFIMTIRAQNRGWKPQIMRNRICHHYRIFALNINEYERLSDQASIEMPKLVREAQQMTAGV
jgi:GT2 family glycosyltransferase